MSPVDTITEPCRLAIKTELEHRGWTQADLARHVGLSEKHISGALTGKVAGYGGLALMLYALGLEVVVISAGTKRASFDREGIPNHWIKEGEYVMVGVEVDQ